MIKILINLNFYEKSWDLKTPPKSNYFTASEKHILLCCLLKWGAKVILPPFFPLSYRVKVKVVASLWHCPSLCTRSKRRPWHRAGTADWDNSGSSAKVWVRQIQYQIANHTLRGIEQEKNITERETSTETEERQQRDRNSCWRSANKEQALFYISALLEHEATDRNRDTTCCFTPQSESACSDRFVTKIHKRWGKRQILMCWCKQNKSSNRCCNLHL